MDTATAFDMLNDSLKDFIIFYDETEAVFFVDAYNQIAEMCNSSCKCVYLHYKSEAGDSFYLIDYVIRSFSVKL